MNNLYTYSLRSELLRIKHVMQRQQGEQGCLGDAPYAPISTSARQGTSFLLHSRMAARTSRSFRHPSHPDLPPPPIALITILTQAGEAEAQEAGAGEKEDEAKRKTQSCTRWRIVWTKSPRAFGV